MVIWHTHKCTLRDTWSMISVLSDVSNPSLQHWQSWSTTDRPGALWCPDPPSSHQEFWIQSSVGWWFCFPFTIVTSFSSQRIKQCIQVKIFNSFHYMYISLIEIQCESVPFIFLSSVLWIVFLLFSVGLATLLFLYYLFSRNI